MMWRLGGAGQRLGEGPAHLRRGIVEEGGQHPDRVNALTLVEIRVKKGAGQCADAIGASARWSGADPRLELVEDHRTTGA